ncbi:MAG: hypothetical protein CVT49_00445 [candidate division Zixibacteria bacterium HGW-Zixibacteria-1]|nr:MAG: hypothetical protein CVT49_00445 [candidate division Zixibacteria bacterium HGW-Zixibacteria-1]
MARGKLVLAAGHIPDQNRGQDPPQHKQGSAPNKFGAATQSPARENQVGGNGVYWRTSGKIHINHKDYY